MSDRWPAYVDRLTRLKLALDQYTVQPDKTITFKEPGIDSVVPLLQDIVKIMGREVFVEELWDKEKLIAELEEICGAETPVRQT
jgi:hypothetical protein